jgi:hypothetical protein
MLEPLWDVVIEEVPVTTQALTKTELFALAARRLREFDAAFTPSLERVFGPRPRRAKRPTKPWTMRIHPTEHGRLKPQCEFATAVKVRSGDLLVKSQFGRNVRDCAASGLEAFNAIARRLFKELTEPHRARRVRAF